MGCNLNILDQTIDLFFMINSSRRIVNCEVMELRYSLNGISESQIQVMFRLIEQESNQLIIRRISDSKFALSSDDLILEGNFSSEFLAEISRTFSPPLSCKLRITEEIEAQIRYYATFSWTNGVMLYGGITVLPMNQTQKMVAYTSPTHFLNLITSTQAGSDLKGLLAVKPKGLISINSNVATIVLPNHRIDFMKEWLFRLGSYEVDLNWLSGSTGELSEEILSSVGSVDAQKMENLPNLLDRAISIPSADLNFMFRKAILSLQG